MTEFFAFIKDLFQQIFSFVTDILKQTGVLDKEEVTEKSDFTCSLEIEKLADYTVNFIEEVYLTDGMVTKSVPFVVIKCNSLDVLKQFKDTDDGEMGKVYDEKALTIKYPNGDPNIFKVENEGDMLVGKDDYISSYKTAGYVCE